MRNLLYKDTREVEGVERYYLFSLVSRGLLFLGYSIVCTGLENAILASEMFACSSRDKQQKGIGERYF